MFPISRYRRLLMAIFLFGLVLLLAIPQFTAAQDVHPPIDPTVLPPIHPPDDPPAIRAPFDSPVDMQLHSIEAIIDGAVAEVHVTQRFFNSTQQTFEGTYVFPLPTDAAIGDLQMTVDGQVLEGKIYSAEEARRIYEEIVRRQRDPALLEYLGQGLFQVSVFPIPAGAVRTVELTYRQILTQEDDLHRFAVPVGGGPSRTLPESLALSVDLRNQPGLRTVYSPSHNVSIQRDGDDSALIGFETTDVEDMQDFVLYFGTDESAIGLDLLSYKPAGEDGFFLLMAAPSVEAASQEIVARDLVLVLDVSGSMEGEKIEQARNAARYVVQHLNPQDHFNLISFSTGTDLWKSDLQAVDSQTQQEALDWIDALRANGSTDINRALLEALGQIQTSTPVSAMDVTDRPAYVLFLTDGLPTQGEQEPARIIANAEQNKPDHRTIRLFTFGVGYDVNTDLLDTLSQDLGGRSRYVRPEEAIDEAVSDFYAGISTPVLSNVSIEVEGAQIEDTYPYPLPDLFAGEQIVWAGRYAEGSPVTVVLEGTVNGEERTFRYEDLSLVQSGGESAVARLWATRKIGALLSEVRRSGSNQEIIDTIVELSLTYGIVTPYTSYLVLEPEMQVEASAPAALAPRTMRYMASDAVAKAVEGEAAADAVGMAAVESSIARTELQEARVVEERQGVRYVAGKSFTQQGTVTTADGGAIPFWVDTLYDDSMATRSVIFGGEDYFTLAADAVTAQWLSLSPEMVLVVDGEAIRVTTQGSEASTDPSSASPLSTPASTVEAQDSEDPGFWARTVEFLRNLLGW